MIFLDKSSNFLDRIIKRNFDRIVRISSLSEDAKKTGRAREPLFMDGARYDNIIKYLFEDDQQEQEYESFKR